MKGKRNTQQVKEHEKCPPSQTKEEKIGNLPEKEFRIMIIKMIQNLENKMELQHIYMEFRKMLIITLYAKQKKIHRCIEQSFRLCGRSRGQDVSREQHRNMYII